MSPKNEFISEARSVSFKDQARSEEDLVYFIQKNGKSGKEASASQFGKHREKRCVAKKEGATLKEQERVTREEGTTLLRTFPVSFFLSIVPALRKKIFVFDLSSQRNKEVTLFLSAHAVIDSIASYPLAERALFGLHRSRVALESMSIGSRTFSHCYAPEFHQVIASNLLATPLVSKGELLSFFSQKQSIIGERLSRGKAVQLLSLSRLPRLASVPRGLDRLGLIPWECPISQSQFQFPFKKQYQNELFLGRNPSFSLLVLYLTRAEKTTQNKKKSIFKRFSYRLLSREQTAIVRLSILFFMAGLETSEEDHHLYPDKSAKPPKSAMSSVRRTRATSKRTAAETASAFLKKRKFEGKPT
ncbi:hypothetical protein IEQ34_023420 [Dendrobium chrysotoxum]|uniref:Uncharacterized protein n=1 Tax=Dendrobium chrysotoxum TaxID=161865 RepID=A0AAV7FT41_DENCH|nr:hypothetical protein IEQ34_024526 [Dendrobium chrysotoxum]KAH0447196.1 hypothetical protein IEQ34_023959 [Dendrobium chrysotoxum]KAH0447201.1 hypothetical protein IEQ34_023964 [Dendrobium chrysotoxum]KAH0447742.1 hypothetical protein IEQ34_023420 [Dendrobium chrysotoxum]